jgi:hypothetical protein
MITRQDKQQHTKHWNLASNVAPRQDAKPPPSTPHIELCKTPFLGPDSAAVLPQGFGFLTVEVIDVRKQSTLSSVHESMQVVCGMFCPEWTSTHQCINLDGWCTDRTLFSIPVPSQVHFFCLPFLSLFSTLISVFFFAFETFPTHPPTTPGCPPPTYSPISLN